MKKKDAKYFFNTIAKGDIATVNRLINEDSEYLTTCNFAPPKKDDGQSGLQLSFKTGHFEIAELLIEKGADVNFMETSAINDWTAPVLHDCIRATIFNSFTLEKDTKRFHKAFQLLQKMVNLNANPKSTDSYGNNCLHRAILDSRQMLDNPSTDFTNNILVQQLQSVFTELLKAGADINEVSEKRESAKEMYLNFRLDKYKLIPLE